MKGRAMRSVTYGKIKVFFKPELDGGGRDFGQEYIPFLKSYLGKVDTICEFGAGPGFIGFSLLANGLCDKLVLTDINSEAIEACNKTIAENNLEKRVRVYVSDGLASIPEQEKWDLVVSNPPHFNGTLEQRTDDIRSIDPGWRIHKAFYKGILRHLRPDGLVIFQECITGSNPETFRSMIEENGMMIKKVETSRHPSLPKAVDSTNRMFAYMLDALLNGSGTLNPVRIFRYIVRTSEYVRIPTPHYFLVVSKR